MLIDNKMYIVHKTNISIRPIKKMSIRYLYNRNLYLFKLPLAHVC